MKGTDFGHDDSLRLVRVPRVDDVERIMYREISDVAGKREYNKADQGDLIRQYGCIRFHIITLTGIRYKFFAMHSPLGGTKLEMA